ncbi:hypothetical protein NSS91_16010 [Caldifermentibacillus hisashii]|uniref:hypothetical protein n=1 Tax=Caldifermentibacillus hisashii TaxID=996558 RepID=UPI0031FD7EC3
MMRVLFSPVVCDKKIDYEFNKEVITAIYEGETDTFDFTGMPDGVLKEVDTVLTVNPIIEARKENGVLSVILTNFISKDAPDEEKFPEWQVIE